MLLLHGFKKIMNYWGATKLDQPRPTQTDRDQPMPTHANQDQPRPTQNNLDQPRPTTPKKPF